MPAIGHYVETPFTVLISCILSLRTQDRTTNAASERLFAIANTPQQMLATPANTIRWVRFQPEGLVFKANPRDGWGALLTTDYTNCVSTNVTGLRIAQITDALGVIQYLQTWTKIKQNPLGTGNQYVAAVIPHFSNYAVAW